MAVQSQRNSCLLGNPGCDAQPEGRYRTIPITHRAHVAGWGAGAGCGAGSCGGAGALFTGWLPF